jgi:hypothetical protein
VLCSARARRQLTNGNGEPVKSISVTVRFASDNPEQVERWTVQPQLDGLERTAHRTRRRINRATTVVPALENRRQAWLADANQRVQAELPPGEDEDAE